MPLRNHIIASDLISVNAACSSS